MYLLETGCCCPYTHLCRSISAALFTPLFCLVSGSCVRLVTSLSLLAVANLWSRMSSTISPSPPLQSLQTPDRVTFPLHRRIFPSSSSSVATWLCRRQQLMPMQYVYSARKENTSNTKGYLGRLVWVWNIIEFYLMLNTEKMCNVVKVLYIWGSVLVKVHNEESLIIGLIFFLRLSIS